MPMMPVMTCVCPARPSTMSAFPARYFFRPVSPEINTFAS